MTIRMLLAEDHALVRAGIRALLLQLPNVEIVAEAGNGTQALDLIVQHQPDIALLDIAMRGMSGLEVAAQVAQRDLDTRVIILSMHANEEYVVQALRAGVVGYLLKDAGTSELELAVQAAIRGDTYLSPGVSSYVIAGYMRRVGAEAEPSEPLTPRQREILQLIAAGRTTKEIAGDLQISVKTVETHRAQLMSRLNIYDIAGLVRYAVRVGLVRPED